MKTAILVLIMALSCAASQCVVMLHGLGRTSVSMKPLERHLKRKGYTVFNLDYPSTRKSIEEICTTHLHDTLQRIEAAHDTVNYVTHSMGAIVLRYYTTAYPASKCNRVVMLCPPNQGSSLADSLSNRLRNLYKATSGPAGQQLRTQDGFAVSTGYPSCSIGVIAGDRSWEPWFSRFIEGDDDGKVSLDEAKFSAMSDFIVLHHTHTFMMNNGDTKAQILAFLRTGRFQR